MRNLFTNECEKIKKMSDYKSGNCNLRLPYATPVLLRGRGKGAGEENDGEGEGR